MPGRFQPPFKVLHRGGQEQGDVTDAERQRRRWDLDFGRTSQVRA